jgi:hypothetical protein
VKMLSINDSERNKILIIKKFVLCLVIYLVMEIAFLTVLKFALINMNKDQYEYLDWVNFFYYPEKKIKFYSYILFLISSWIYWGIAYYVIHGNKEKKCS